MSAHALDYDAFIAHKLTSAPSVGLTTHGPLSSKLFPFQATLVGAALRKGRYALFADTGLGKGWMTLEWCRVVAQETARPVLLLAPLAVSRQFEREAGKLGAPVRIVASAADVGPGINITNYHKLHKFDVAAFGGVALDESSILKSYDGTTRTALVESFKHTPFRLCATATPSPNDHAELGNHAEFLGVCSRAEMLATYFVHDGEQGSSQGWRLKGHAKAPFWRWVASWAASLRKPSDIGCDDDGRYALPPLTHVSHVIEADRADVFATGALFAANASTLTEQRKARRATLSKRVAKAAEIVNAHDEPAIVWCDLNDEGDALESSIRGAAQLSGRDDDDSQERKIADFVEGRTRVLVGKASQIGFGLNFQHAREVVFCGVSHSFEQYYQAIRRVWRFGQTRDVRVHVISSELEGAVVESLKRKEADAQEMATAMVAAMADFMRKEITATGRQTIAYEPRSPMRLPTWLRTEGT